MNAQARTDASKPELSRSHMPIGEAAGAYGVSARSLFHLLAQGRLTRYRRAADRRTFCSVDELERVFKPAAEPGMSSDSTAKRRAVTAAKAHNRAGTKPVEPEDF